MEKWEYDLLFFNAIVNINNWIEHECELLEGQLNFELAFLHDLIDIQIQSLPLLK